MKSQDGVFSWGGGGVLFYGIYHNSVISGIMPENKSNYSIPDKPIWKMTMMDDYLGSKKCNYIGLINVNTLLVIMVEYLFLPRFREGF